MNANFVKKVKKHQPLENRFNNWYWDRDCVLLVLMSIVQKIK